MAAVTIEGIEKLYRLGKRNVVHALRGTSLTVGDGEFVAVMGPSGSGKSTLLNVIGCLSGVTAGHVFVGVQDVTKLKPRDLDRIRAREIGFIFQTFGLMPTRTALENVMLAAEYAGMGLRERLERAKAVLEQVGLGERLDHFPSELSGGEQQRVAFARALVKSPKLLLADEPTGNLDSVAAEEIMDLLRELRGEGQAVVMVTHDARMAAYADRIIFLKDGRVVDEEQLRATASAAIDGR